jgi:hypothetical protein
MALIGYARVSTDDQNLGPQLDSLRAAGCGEIFEEYASGGDQSRPQLTAALARVERDDILVVARIDRLARSLSHLLAVVETLRARGAHFKSLADPIDTAGPSGVLVLQMLGAVAEFERALIRERTMVGVKAARARGRVATVFFVPLSTPPSLLSECRRARCGQGQAASRWPSAILDLRCARRLGRGQVGTKERSGFDRTKELRISSLVVGRVPSRTCRASWR